MTDNMKLPSLLPYLQSGSGRFHLMIRLEPTDESSPFEPCLNPFLFRDVSDPFTLLGSAGVISDLAEQVLPLTMLLQRSDYHCSPENLHLHTNLAIEQRWQQIMSVFSAPPYNTLCFLLAEQIGKQGQILPFHSLFYCRAKQIFFPPPCPDCGKELVLCMDDALLSLHGLAGYSTSLQRFLYCPYCCSPPAAGTYYTFRRTEKDPESVRDIQQLIRNWIQSEKTAAPDALLPCGKCPSYKVCYGSTPLAVNALCSFSFYPFYMLLLKADPELQLDIQALLSGKTPQDCFCGEKNMVETAPPMQSTQPETSGHGPETDIPDANAAANDAIHAILVDISAQWQRSEQENAQPPQNGDTGPSSKTPSSRPTEQADLMETVILSSPPVAPGGAQAILSEKGAFTQKETEFVPETTMAVPPPFDPDATMRIHHTMPESRPPEKQPVAPSMNDRLEENLQETIIMSPQKGQQQSHPRPSPLPENTDPGILQSGPAPFSDGKTVERDLAETIIQRPVKKP
jgi:hypothetical protein